jgi:hypothetical protein
LRETTSWSKAPSGKFQYAIKSLISKEQLTITFAASMLAMYGQGDEKWRYEHIDGDGPTIFAHACKMGLCRSARTRSTARGARPIGSR